MSYLKKALKKACEKGEQVVIFTFDENKGKLLSNVDEQTTKQMLSQILEEISQD